MEQNVRKYGIISRFAAICAAAVLSLCGAAGYYAHSLPDRLVTSGDGAVSVQTLLPVTVHREPPVGSERAELRLFGVLPLKSVAVTTVSPSAVYVGGEPFGIRMMMAGVMVVSLGEIHTADGTASPAREAGIQVGDIIQTVNGRDICGNADLQEAVACSGGESVTVTLLRGGEELTRTVMPVFAPLTGRWQTGMWVRDSTAGIGTVTYYALTPAGEVQFAGLGHAVCDTDTGERIPLASGEVAAVEIRDVVRGTAGKPGELRGTFQSQHNAGTLRSNTAGGVFGTLERLPARQMLMPVAAGGEIRRGAAMIYATLQGSTPEAYSVQIEEIRENDANMRNLVVHVTDSRLLERSGGIVQGMSGSPIVQDGRLVGAVTHVFVKDPTRGYGIFAENMLTAA